MHDKDGEPAPLPVNADGPKPASSQGLIWMLAAVIAAGCLFGLRNGTDESASSIKTASTTPIITEVLFQQIEVALPDGSRISIIEGTPAWQLRQALEEPVPTTEPVPLAELDFLPETAAFGQGAAEMLEALAAVLLNAPAARVRIMPPVDGGGNPTLALSRAEAVRAAFLAAGVLPEQLETGVPGIDQPPADPHFSLIVLSQA